MVWGSFLHKQPIEAMISSLPLIPTSSRDKTLCAPSPCQEETDVCQESHLGSLAWTSSVGDIQTTIRPTREKAKRQRIVAGQLPRTESKEGCSGRGCTLKVPMKVPVWRELEWCHFDSIQEAHLEGYRTSACQAQRAPVPYHGCPDFTGPLSSPVLF